MSEGPENVTEETRWIDKSLTHAYVYPRDPGGWYAMTLPSYGTDYTMGDQTT